MAHRKQATRQASQAIRTIIKAARELTEAERVLLRTKPDREGKPTLLSRGGAS